MKNLSKLLICLLLSLPALAQVKTKNDVILQLNGDELTGKVTEIGENSVKFTHAGETLVYNIKKAEIEKITYASGRVEVFNKRAEMPASRAQAPGSVSTDASGADHHNKVAILPFGFIRDGQKGADEMSAVVQTACFNFLNKHAGVFTILDTRNTNAKLIRAGVTAETIQGYTMDDLCNILGAEFLVDGTVVLNKQSQTSLASSSSSNKTKQGENERKSSSYTSASATSYENFDTTINLDIYNDKGNKLFGQSRKSFFNTQDAYQSALEYVLKRSPLYTKK